MRSKSGACGKFTTVPRRTKFSEKVVRGTGPISGSVDCRDLGGACTWLGRSGGSVVRGKPAGIASGL